MELVASFLLGQYLYRDRRLDLFYGDASHVMECSPSLLQKVTTSKHIPSHGGKDDECKGNLLELCCITE